MKRIIALLVAGLFSVASIAQNANPGKNMQSVSITCPVDAYATTDPGLSTTSNVMLGTPVTDPQFPLVTVTNNAPLVFPVGTTQVDWTATGDSGGYATCIQLVTVADNEPPVISCLQDQERSTDPGSCNYTVINDEFDPVSYSDNCPGFWIINDFNYSATLAGAIFPKGTTTVTWFITDAFFNTSYCSFDVKVNDLEMPIISCIDDPERYLLPGTCSYTVTGSEFDPLSFSDNCGLASLTNNFNSSNSLTGAVFPLGYTVIIWTLTDESGNTAYCGYELEVKDTLLPLINCPGDQVRSTDPSSPDYKVVGNEFDPVSYSDNCSITGIQNDYNGLSTLAGAVFPLGAIPITWTITDAGNNASSCSFMIVVTDDEAPVIDCIDDQIKWTDDDTNTYTVINDEFDPTYYYDNCPGPLVINDYNLSGTLAGAAFPIGITTVTWIITDAGFNVSTCSFNITVKDHTIKSKYNCKSVQINSDTKNFTNSGEDNTDATGITYMNYPDPFTDKTTFSILLPADDHIKVDIYDLAGKHIDNLLDASTNNNQENLIEFDGSNLAAGMYLCTVTTSSGLFKSKIISKE